MVKGPVAPDPEPDPDPDPDPDPEPEPEPKPEPEPEPEPEPVLAGPFTPLQEVKTSAVIKTQVKNKSLVACFISDPFRRSEDWQRFSIRLAL